MKFIGTILFIFAGQMVFANTCVPYFKPSNVVSLTERLQKRQQESLRSITARAKAYELDPAEQKIYDSILKAYKFIFEGGPEGERHLTLKLLAVDGVPTKGDRIEKASFTFWESFSSADSSKDVGLQMGFDGHERLTRMAREQTLLTLDIGASNPTEMIYESKSYKEYLGSIHVYRDGNELRISRDYMSERMGESVHKTYAWIYRKNKLGEIDEIDIIYSENDLTLRLQFRQ